MINNYSFCLKTLPPKCGVSITARPHEIITGIKIDYNRHCKIQFGYYVQDHKENNPTNSIGFRTIEVILIGQSSNIQVV